MDYLYPSLMKAVVILPDDWYPKAHHPDYSEKSVQTPPVFRNSSSRSGKFFPHLHPFQMHPPVSEPLFLFVPRSCLHVYEMPPSKQLLSESSQDQNRGYSI